MDFTSFRPARRLVLAVGIAAGLVAAPLSAPLAANAANSVDGVWQMDGYGTIVAIDDGKAELFSTTSISCTPAAVYEQSGNRFTAEEEQAFTVRARRDRAVLQVEGNVGDKHLRRLAKLPTHCTVPGATGPLAVFDQFWTTYAENYPFFAAKGIDWAEVRDTYRPRVTPDISEDALFDLLSEMIKPLGDAHTALRTGTKTFAGVRPGTTLPSPELEAELRPYIEQTTLKGTRMTTYANGLIGYADLPGRIGYLRVVNGGGSDQLGLDLASRFTGRPFFAYAKRARNNPADPSAFTAAQPIFVQPSERTKYTGPIAMLTGGSQLSAGETFTQAMMNRSPRPVRIGQNTQGVFSDVLVRTLPNGWRFIVPNEEFRTRDWTTFDGPGIPPDLRTPVFTADELQEGRDTAFSTALKLLVR